MCEYNDMVHISDWYDIMVGGLARIHYEPDSDHSDIDVWGNIRCKCRGTSSQYCDNNYPPRDELIMMRMCGIVDSNYGTDKLFYSTYVRKGDYKLVVKSDLLCFQLVNTFLIVVLLKIRLLFVKLR